jgi:hypothetical protein
MPIVNNVPQSTAPITKKKKRVFVKNHKDALIVLSQNPVVKHSATLALHKLIHDYKSVASKRGSSTFDINRWIKSNLK